MKKVSILSVGIGGYGEILTSDILVNGESNGVEICAAVEPFPDSCRLTEKLKQLNIPVYKDMKDFYGSGKKADLAVIATPIQFHTQHIITALDGGSNVICEKPLCADKNDIELISQAEIKAGKFVYIGYQWSHSEAIENLKKDVMAGIFGSPRELKTLVIWPRNADYFNRGSGWAGKIKGNGGALIYDSIANNAAAHYLHNMFYLLGSKLNSSLEPACFEAELLRANNIENFDTAVIKCEFENKVSALFVASHATDKNLNPVFDYKFEKGRVLYSQDQTPDNINDANLYKKDCITAVMNDGSVKDYGNPFDGVCRKVYIAAEASRGGKNGYERCGIEAAAVHTRFINKLQETCSTENFPKEMIKTDGKNTYVEGLYQKLIDIYDGKASRILG